MTNKGPRHRSAGCIVRIESGPQRCRSLRPDAKRYAHDPDDGDQGHQQRGLAIAILAQDHIRPDKFGYKVPSQSGNGVYLVNLEDGPYCTCPDFEKRNSACKHVYAVEALLHRSERLDEDPPKPVRVTQPWAAFCAAYLGI